MHPRDLTRPDPLRTPRTSRRGRAMGTAALAVCAALIPASTGFTQGAPPDDPNGNNGTVKVDGIAFDDHPGNEPHPGCVFQIDFYGFDAGVGDAQVSFALQAPTTDGTLAVESGDLTPDIGEDAAGGGTDLDAAETYRLAFTGAPAKQGYHVKLTVNAPGSIGADTKHKVFWVSGCDAPAPPPPPAPPAPQAPPAANPGGGGQVSGGTTGTGPDGAVLGGRQDAEPGSVVAGAQVDAGTATPVAEAAAAAPVQGAPTFTG